MTKKPEQQSSNPVQKASKPSAWKRFFKKRWVFPGIYMLAAALIIAFMWWYQGSRMNVDPNQMGFDQEQEDLIDIGQDLSDDAIPADAEAEDDAMISPVADDVNMTMAFYDDDASEEEKEAALVEYGNSYNPHTGVDFAREDGEPFDVLAVMGGTVQSVEANPLNGQEVRIAHENGMETVYQSLAEVTVDEGDTLSQGDVIGTAGRNKVEKDSGVHLHFEVNQDGQPVNPEEHLPTEGMADPEDPSTEDKPDEDEQAE